MPDSKAERIAGKKGLPSNPQAEALVIGSILLDDSSFPNIAISLKASDFSLDSHQKIYRRMEEIKNRGEKVDRITLANELIRYNEIQEIGGLTYLSSLDEGLPKIAHLDGYVKIVKDKSAARRIIAIGQHLQNRALLEQDPPESILHDGERQLADLEAGLFSAKTSWTFTEVVESKGGLGSFLEPVKNGISTGYKSLDGYVYGLQPGNLYVIGGDSSHGKSALLGNIAMHVTSGFNGSEIAGDSSPFGLFTLEMPRDNFYTRILCGKARVSYWKLQKGFLNQEERRRLQFASAEMSRSPLHIDDTSGLSIAELCNRARRMKREHGVKVVAVDYIQLLNWREDGMKTEYEGVTYSTYSLKQLAKSEGLPVIALSQFHQEYSRRKNKGERPTVDSMHGSGAIKKDADVVGLLYRLKQAYPHNSDFENVTELILAKHRNGRTGTILMDWHPEYTTFEEQAEEKQPGYGENK